MIYDIFNLSQTEQLMKKKESNKDFDSYAVYVKIKDYEVSFTSLNVNEDTYFDIASCGKIFVTTPLVLQAIGRKKLSLESTLDDFFDDVPSEKKDITVKQLLTHTSGIVRIPLTAEAVQGGRVALAKEILSASLAFKPGDNYIYSCNGMILLGFILEKIYNDTLENIFENNIKKPLGYTRSKFTVTTDEKNYAVCCRYEKLDGRKYMFDDENISVLQTPAGSGGQFFTLADIKKFAHATLSKNELLYPKELFDLAEKEHSPKCASESRGLGWLYVDEKYSQTGKLFPTGSFGHTGHCGQSIFFNREKDMCVVILTNATRFANMRSGWKGYDYSEIQNMRTDIHNAIYDDLTLQGLI